MREIKFRAWARRGEWGEGGAKRRFVMVGSEVLAFEEYELVCDLLKDIDDDFYLMQYTGLKDKNGKEIYEGDVVNCRIRGDEGSPPTSITKQPVTYGTGSYLVGCWSTWFCYQYEVIGNIYENPEMLEEVK